MMINGNASAERLSALVKSGKALVVLLDPQAARTLGMSQKGSRRRRRKTKRTAPVFHYAAEAIRAEMTNDDAAEYVRQSVAGAKTTADCINTYRSHLRARGEQVLSNAEVLARQTMRRAVA